MSSRKLRPFLGVQCIAAGLFCLVLSPSSATNRNEIPAARFNPARVADHPKIGKMKCRECHEDLVTKKNVHPPTTDGCDACHEYKEKGETAEVKFTMEGSELCGMCHTDQKEQVDTKKFAHPPAKDLGCVLCHTPHSSDYAFLLRAEPQNLCFACHKLNVKQQRTETGRLIIFPATTVPADYRDKAKKIFLGPDDKGHPFIGHPVGGIFDLPKKGSRMSCTTCHNPHAGNYVQLYQKDLRGQALCDTCHK